VNQNKSDAARLRAADQLQAHNIGFDTAMLAAYMRQV